MKVRGKVCVKVICFVFLFGIWVAAGSVAAQQAPAEPGVMSAEQPAGWLDVDLVVNEIRAPSTGKAGKFVRVGLDVENEGLDLAEHFRVGVYLSKDRVINPRNDQIIGGIWLDALPVLANSNFALVLMIPESTAPGQYYIGAFIDDTRAVAEDNESNNRRAGRTPIQIDAAQ